MRLLRHLLFPAIWAAGLAVAACGTDAAATDACRKIEQARCRRAPACPDLMVQAGVGIEECVQFARDRCLHGLAVPDPGAAVVDKCVTAIEQSTRCDEIAAPESIPACAFLQPTPTADAGLDAENDSTDATVIDTGASATDADADLSDGG